MRLLRSEIVAIETVPVSMDRVGKGTYRVEMDCGHSKYSTRHLKIGMTTRCQRCLQDRKFRKDRGRVTLR